MAVVLPSTIPISERIVRQIRTQIAALGCVEACYRGHSVAAENLGHYDAVVEDVGETPADEPSGSIGYADLILEVVASIKYVVAQTETATAESPGARRHLLQAELRKSLLSNRTVVETGTGARLAIDTLSVTREPPEFDSGAMWCGVRARIHYRTPANDPYTADGVSAASES